jgi:hypothetical protein
MIFLFSYLTFYKFEENTQIGRPSRKREDNIKMDVNECF